MTELKFEGAGFFLINPAVDLLLALVDGAGLYDLPKGVRESRETAIETAKRECFEECAILIEDNEIMSCGPFYDGRLVVFCAETLKNPAIFPNEKSKILEHSAYQWVSPTEFLKNCVPYLRPISRKIFSELSKRAHPLMRDYI